jgi:hypothetical protein
MEKTKQMFHQTESQQKNLSRLAIHWKTWFSSDSVGFATMDGFTRATNMASVSSAQT